MRRFALFPAITFLVATAAAAQLTLPPSGDNQKASVTQWIGPVSVRIDYSSPDVHAPNGDDRRGKIWGTLVPYGMIDEDFGTCTTCPWRAGANENTVFTVSHDVLVNGQKLPAGSYGLHMIADPNEWTVIFSKNYTSWGSYTYDPNEDALRVKAKPAKAEYNEWLTYEFIDRQGDKATVALKWEELAVPFTVEVPNVSDLYISQIKNEMRSAPGFKNVNYVDAARYALQTKHLDEALTWAQQAVTVPFFGRENFETLSLLADVQEAKGLTTEARVTRDKAVAHPTATAPLLHQYARQNFMRGNKTAAVAIWKANAKRFGTAWPVNVGLARAYSADGDYKNALKHAKLALAQAPDDVNRKSLTDAIKKLEEGKDMN